MIELAWLLMPVLGLAAFALMAAFGGADSRDLLRDDHRR